MPRTVYRGRGGEPSNDSTTASLIFQSNLNSAPSGNALPVSGELLQDLTAALADQTIHDRVRHFAKYSLLIIG